MKLRLQSIKIERVIAPIIFQFGGALKRSLSPLILMKVHRTLIIYNAGSALTLCSRNSNQWYYML